MQLPMMDSDSKYMARALELANLGQGLVSPNPLVGAVIVRDGRIVGEGFHQFALVRHAESYALEMAGPLARRATLYCNLEPCCHHGRTRPCTDALIEAGIARAVVAIRDPDSRVNDRGFDRLRSAGIDVRVGLMAAEAARQNEIYLKDSATGRPFVHAVSGVARGGAAAGRCHSLAELPSGWQPSTSLLRLCRRYDLLVVGEISASGLAIAREYVESARHRVPIIAAYAGSIECLKEELGPGARTAVSFIVLDNLSTPESGPLLPDYSGASPELDITLAGEAPRTGPRRGQVSLEGLMAAASGERITSLLMLGVPANLGTYPYHLDKVTLIIDPREIPDPDCFELAGSAVVRMSETERDPAGRFIEVSGYPVRQ